jgi:hypothetical protein
MGQRMLTYFFSVMIIFFSANVFGQNASEPVDAQKRIIKRLIFIANTRGGLAIDATFYDEAPNRIEGICYRLGRFTQAVVSAAEAAEHTQFSSRLSAGALEAERVLSASCGGIAAQNANIKVDLSSAEKIQTWIKELEVKVNSVREKLEID